MWRPIVESMLNRVHLSLFGHNISAVMREFVKNLSLSLVGYVLANAILYSAIVSAGRLLGAYQFGQYALVMALAQILVIPMMPGVDLAVMREVALGRLPRRRVVASGGQFLAATITVVALLALFLASQISNLIGVPTMVFRVSVLVAAAFGLKTFFDGVVRGLGKFNVQWWVRVVEATVVLTVFLLGYAVLPGGDYRLLTGGVALGALIGAWLLYQSSVVGWLAWRYADRHIVAELWRYGRAGVLGAIGIILLGSADKVILGAALGTQALGVYQAYYFASVLLTGQLSLVFLNVFFPVVVKHRDLTIVLRKIDRMIVIGFGPVLALVALFLSGTLWLFGSEFERDGKLVAVMSLYAVLWFLFTAYVSLISTTGPGGILYASTNSLIAGVLYLATLSQLVDLIGLFAPAVSFLVAFTYMAGAVVLWRLKFRRWLR